MRVRRILQLAGHSLHLGLPGPQDGVIVWGKSPYARRGEWVAARREVPLIRVEDAFLRSVHPGAAHPPLGLMIGEGVHFDASVPSTLERLIAGPMDEALLTRARDGIDRLRRIGLSKYNAFDPAAPLPPPGYVLVIDQVRGDASAPDPTAFARMLEAARDENPGKPVVVKGHPAKPGHLDGGYADASPWRLLERAGAVYAVSSQMGFEAVLAGHRPRIFGTPFYAGWGLTADEHPLPRRRPASAEALFAAAMILAPTWYDPCHDRLCSFEEAVDQLEAETRAFREDRHGHVALGMRLWKRRHMQQVFGREKPLIFTDDPARAKTLAEAQGRGILVWAGREPKGFASAQPIRRVEDGFLRSRGLGAELVPPLSLVTDLSGIYYDPSRPSGIDGAGDGDLPRARRLVERLIATGLSKYNLGGAVPDLPSGRRILVPGQVEDDASIRLGGGAVRRNADLLAVVRRENPDAVIVYKPHPDVEAGLRPGAIDAEADVIARHADPIALIDACDEVWTMTSLLGFEALLRGKPVTCLGAPFYAGRGLTRDLGPVPDRSPMTLLALAHAALIAYPRYHDPVSGLPCPPEVIMDRLAHGPIPHPGRANRLLAKAQGLLASRAHLWRQ
ncbi:capsular polysaccharide biosynthesis protein [Cereibacter sp. SYSU M97828]|nr:capsular polysaccharide biosynthesis protein [Cereibacter flavus]